MEKSILDLLRSGLEEQVEIFPVDLRFMKSKKKFAYKVWRLGKLEREYRLILSDIYALENQEGKEKEKLVLLGRSAFQK